MHPLSLNSSRSIPILLFILTFIIAAVLTTSSFAIEITTNQYGCAKYDPNQFIGSQRPPVLNLAIPFSSPADCDPDGTFSVAQSKTSTGSHTFSCECKIGYSGLKCQFKITLTSGVGAVVIRSPQFPNGYAYPGSSLTFFFIHKSIHNRLRFRWGYINQITNPNRYTILDTIPFLKDDPGLVEHPLDLLLGGSYQGVFMRNSPTFHSTVAPNQFIVALFVPITQELPIFVNNNPLCLTLLSYEVNNNDININSVDYSTVHLEPIFQLTVFSKMESVPEINLSSIPIGSSLSCTVPQYDLNNNGICTCLDPYRFGSNCDILTKPTSLYAAVQDPGGFLSTPNFSPSNFWVTLTPPITFPVAGATSTFLSSSTPTAIGSKYIAKFTLNDTVDPSTIPVLTEKTHITVFLTVYDSIGDKSHTYPFVMLLTPHCSQYYSKFEYNPEGTSHCNSVQSHTIDSPSPTVFCKQGFFGPGCFYSMEAFVQSDNSILKSGSQSFFGIPISISLTKNDPIKGYSPIESTILNEIELQWSLGGYERPISVPVSKWFDSSIATITTLVLKPSQEHLGVDIADVAWITIKYAGEIVFHHDFDIHSVCSRFPGSEVDSHIIACIPSGFICESGWYGPKCQTYRGGIRHTNTAFSTLPYLYHGAQVTFENVVPTTTASPNPHDFVYSIESSLSPFSSDYFVPDISTRPLYGTLDESQPSFVTKLSYPTPPQLNSLNPNVKKFVFSQSLAHIFISVLSFPDFEMGSMSTTFVDFFPIFTCALIDKHQSTLPSFVRPACYLPNSAHCELVGYIDSNFDGEYCKCTEISAGEQCQTLVQVTTTNAPSTTITISTPPNYDQPISIVRSVDPISVPIDTVSSSVIDLTINPIDRNFWSSFSIEYLPSSPNSPKIYPIRSVSYPTLVNFITIESLPTPTKACAHGVLTKDENNNLTCSCHLSFYGDLCELYIVFTDKDGQIFGLISSQFTTSRQELYVQVGSVLPQPTEIPPTFFFFGNFVSSFSTLHPGHRLTVGMPPVKVTLPRVQNGIILPYGFQAFIVHAGVSKEMSSSILLLKDECDAAALKFPSCFPSSSTNKCDQNESTVQAACRGECLLGRYETADIPLPSCGREIGFIPSLIAIKDEEDPTEEEKYIMVTGQKYQFQCPSDLENLPPGAITASLQLNVLTSEILIDVIAGSKCQMILPTYTELGFTPVPGSPVELMGILTLFDNSSSQSAIAVQFPIRLAETADFANSIIESALGFRRMDAKPTFQVCNPEGTVSTKVFEFFTEVCECLPLWYGQYCDIKFEYSILPGYVNHIITFKIAFAQTAIDTFYTLYKEEFLLGLTPLFNVPTIQYLDSVMGTEQVFPVAQSDNPTRNIMPGVVTGVEYIISVQHMPSGEGSSSDFSLKFVRQSMPIGSDPNFPFLANIKAQESDYTPYCTITDTNCNSVGTRECENIEEPVTATKWWCICNLSTKTYGTNCSTIQGNISPIITEPSLLSYPDSILAVLDPNKISANGSYYVGQKVLVTGLDAAWVDGDKFDPVADPTLLQLFTDDDFQNPFLYYSPTQSAAENTFLIPNPPANGNFWYKSQRHVDFNVSPTRFDYVWPIVDQCQWFYDNHVTPWIDGTGLPCRIASSVSCDLEAVELADMCTCQSFINSDNKIVHSFGTYCENTIYIPIGPYYIGQRLNLIVTHDINYFGNDNDILDSIQLSTWFDIPDVFTLVPITRRTIEFSANQFTTIIYEVEIPSSITPVVPQPNFQTIVDIAALTHFRWTISSSNTILSFGEAIEAFIITDPCYWTRLTRYHTICAEEIDPLTGDYIAVASCIDPETHSIKCTCKPGFNLDECRFKFDVLTPPTQFGPNPEDARYHNNQRMILSSKWIGQSDLDPNHIFTPYHQIYNPFSIGNILLPIIPEPIYYPAGQEWIHVFEPHIVESKYQLYSPRALLPASGVGPEKQTPPSLMAFSFELVSTSLPDIPYVRASSGRVKNIDVEFDPRRKSLNDWQLASNLPFQWTSSIPTISTRNWLKKSYDLTCPGGFSDGQGCICGHFGVFGPNCSWQLELSRTDGVYSPPIIGIWTPNTTYSYDFTLIKPISSISGIKAENEIKLPKKYHFELERLSSNGYHHIIVIEPDLIQNTFTLPNQGLGYALDTSGLYLVSDDDNDNGDNRDVDGSNPQRFYLIPLRSTFIITCVAENTISHLTLRPSIGFSGGVAVCGCKNGFYGTQCQNRITTGPLQFEHPSTISPNTTPNTNIIININQLDPSDPDSKFRGAYFIVSPNTFGPQLPFKHEFVITSDNLDDIFDATAIRLTYNGPLHDFSGRSTEYTLVLRFILQANIPTDPEIPIDPSSYTYFPIHQPMIIHTPQCLISGMTVTGCSPKGLIKTVVDVPFSFDKPASNHYTGNTITNTYPGSTVILSIPNYREITDNILVQLKSYPIINPATNQYSSTPIIVNVVYIPIISSSLDDMVIFSATIPQNLIAKKLFFTITFPSTSSSPEIKLDSQLFATISKCFNKPANVNQHATASSWSTSCGDHGTCSNLTQQCTCKPGWEGLVCSNQITPCIQCPADHISSCREETNQCVCKSDWGGFNCQTESRCVETSSKRCNGKNGYLAPPPNKNECSDTCICNNLWIGSSCQTCLLDCLNGGKPSKNCDKCGCASGYTGNDCSCRSVKGSVTVNGWNGALVRYIQLLKANPQIDIENLDDESKLTPELIESIGASNAVHYYVTTIFTRLMELDIDTTKVLMSALMNPASGTDNTLSHTSISITFTFGCVNKNNNLSYDNLLNRWNEISVRLLADAEFKSLFTFPSEPSVTPDDLVDTPETPPEPDNEDPTTPINASIDNTLSFTSFITIFIAIAILYTF